MSRLDQHVLAVRNRLMLARFITALGWTTLALAACTLLAVLFRIFFQLTLPWPHIFLYAGLALAVGFALGYALLTRPDPLTAAVAIDEKLNLKEKYSTALHLRTSRDPFAQAAVRDAEATAGKTLVETRRYFPLSFPRPAYGTLTLATLSLCLFYFVSPLNLFGHAASQDQTTTVTQRQAEAKQALATAYVKVEAAAKANPDNVTIQNAKKDLEALLQSAPKDPASAQRSALKALQDTRDAVTQKIQDSQAFANAKNDERMFRSMTPPATETGPVAEAHRALAEGNFDKAIKDLEKATQNFDKMEKKDQEKAAQQMKAMAQQLQKMAQNPQQQQQMQQQLQRMGANQQQAKQMQQLMQQAAAGNQQAQQQLQQMAQQLQQQMNNGKGPTQQQQQQIQQMMKQMQAQAGSQQQAQAMAQAAQQMAQAMQQAAKAGQQGGQQQQQAGQQMSQAQQQMQQQMAAMDAIQKDAAAQQAQAQDLGDAADAAAGNCNGNGDPKEGGQLAGRKNGANPWKPGDPKGKGKGMGGPGIGAGGVAEKETAPFTVKAEKAPVQDIANGKILAATLVKAGTLKGESKEQLKEIAKSAQQDATDEVDQELITRSTQQAVKGYFNSMEQDATK